MSKHDDSLFLLEVLVDKIVFVKSPCFSDKDFKTCVLFECQGLEPLEICDEDSDSCAAKSGGPFIKKLNRGKSCLFPMKESDIASAMSKFPIKVTVYKSLPCGCIPTKIIMGEATIDMTKEFVEARNRFLANPMSISYQTLKDSFRISGPDGNETGEILLFLRISCFGNLIVTHFQGGIPPSLGVGTGNNIIDRSCNPRKEYQTVQDPCACGATKSSGVGTSSGKNAVCNTMGSGVCPPDPYNSMPCQDSDDPCYCTGPKFSKKSQMACRNIDQYCLHVPKGTMLNLPCTQEVTEGIYKKMFTPMDLINMDNKVKCNVTESCDRINYRNNFFEEYFKDLNLNSHLLLKSGIHSIVSFITLRSKRSICSNTTNLRSKSDCTLSELDILNIDNTPSNFITDTTAHETAVYMTLLDEIYHNSLSTNQLCLSTAGTQATASINKCLQVQCKIRSKKELDLNGKSYFYSPCLMSNSECCANNNLAGKRYSDVYFFNRKRDMRKKSSRNSERPGMGISNTGKKLQRMSQTSSKIMNNESMTSQMRKSSDSSTITTTKTVSIKDEKKCNIKNCPALLKSSMNSEMIATVSHITLGPRKPCPIHAQKPCEGPKCTVDPSPEEFASVKVTTMTNPRRGVFELIIRRITGAPLAKNELMLEWSPPPNRQSYQLCSPPVLCRQPKCKLLICRPSSCQQKRCRKPHVPPCRTLPNNSQFCRYCKMYKNCFHHCKRYLPSPCPPTPCTPSPCTPSPCTLSPCTPCPPSRSCPPPRKIFKCYYLSSRYKSCPKSPCDHCGASCTKQSCLPLTCKPCPSPCKSCLSSTICNASCRKVLCNNCTLSPCNPCFRTIPCPRICALRRKTRKCKKVPKLKPRRKRISPCMNRSRACPVVRCRSSPVPACIIPCSLRKCCSIISCSPLSETNKKK
ncbi:hypothetical protein ACJJTC_000712 [Scirpophaga incertulas]